MHYIYVLASTDFGQLYLVMRYYKYVFITDWSLIIPDHGVFEIYASFLYAFAVHSEFEIYN